MANTILVAVYGTPNTGVDVSNYGLQNMTSVPVNNTTFPDPDFGVPKSFGILYSSQTLNSGHPIALACPENTTLVLVPTTATTSLQPPLAPAGTVKVIGAVYGTKNNGNDVTAICQALVNHGNYIMPVNNTVMGPDPDFGTAKSFCIFYMVSSGRTFGLACPENTNLRLTNVP